MLMKHDKPLEIPDDGRRYYFVLLLNYANASIDVALTAVSAAVEQTSALQPGDGAATGGLSLTPRDEYLLRGLNGDLHARMAELNGEPLALSGAGSDGQARRAQHIAHVPEDRQREGG